MSSSVAPPVFASDADIEALVSKLDLETKVRLLSGASVWTTEAVPEIGLRSMTLSDGPIGVRGGTDTELEPSVALPTASAMAASWDEDLMRRVGGVLAGEAIRKNVDVLLGPTINLHRSPLGGRHFECFSEDPVLSGRLATAYVHGLQENGIGSCPKHFVANDAETDRMSVDNVVDERTLRELYLAPFEAVIADADPWTVMAAYNGVNGHPMTENDLLAEPLKGEWGFRGAVVTDWGAVYNGEPAARAAVDLAMPGPEPKWANGLVDAVRAGRVAESDIDDKVRRLLTLAARAGALEGFEPAVRPAVPPRIEDGAPLARETASAGMVLLRNDGLLPLDRERLTTVAVIGPGARDARALGGGSATVPLPYLVTPTAGIAAALAGRAEVVSATGASLSDSLRPARADELVGDDGMVGAVIRWIDDDGRVVEEQEIGTAVIVRPRSEVPAGATGLEVHTRFTPDTDGQWFIGVTGFGKCELAVAGAPAAGGFALQETVDIAQIFLDSPQYASEFPLQAGTGVDVEIRYRWPADAFLFRVGLVVGQPRMSADDELAAAVELARTSDIAVVVVGTSEDVESEGFDRTSLLLPGRQDELVRAVAAVNPRTVVVVNAGAPVEMDWRNEISAVLLAWFPGMEFGNALADVLFGAVEPGGHLPTTWPAALADVPVRNTTPTAGQLAYSEGLHIGHRGYLAAGTEPAYWFGHGLGYTTWSFEAIDAPVSDDAAGFSVTVRLRNTGHRAGKQVVQVYASRPGSAIDRPVRWLAGFAVVTAEPGESVDAVIEISPRVLRHWDITTSAWEIEAGDVVLSTGPNAGETRLETVVQLRPASLRV